MRVLQGACSCAASVVLAYSWCFAGHVLVCFSGVVSVVLRIAYVLLECCMSILINLSHVSISECLYTNLANIKDVLMFSS